MAVEPAQGGAHQEKDGAVISSSPLITQSHLPKVGEHEPGAPLRLVRFLKLIEKINQRSLTEQESQAAATNGKKL